MLKHYRVMGPNYCTGSISIEGAYAIKIESSLKDITEFFYEKIHEKYPALEIKKELIKIEKSEHPNTVQVLKYDCPKTRDTWTIFEITLVA